MSRIVRIVAIILVITSAWGYMAIAFLETNGIETNLLAKLTICGLVAACVAIVVTQTDKLL